MLKGSGALHGRRVLLTGSSGIVGCELLVELLAAGAEVVALLRPRGALSAAERIAQLLAHGGVEPKTAKVTVLAGDLHTLAELTHSDRETLRSVSDVVHCAALTAFDAAQAAALFRTNVQGALELLAEFAGTNAVFHHISSSYVAGTHPEPFDEEQLDVGQGFVNAYENSKFEAEQRLKAAAIEQHTPLKIYRPSIVVGSAKTGRISNFTSLYPFLRLSVAPLQRPVRIACNADTVLNIVPVDWVARAVIELMTCAPGPTTFHLTNPRPPTLRQLWGWAHAHSPNCQVSFCAELHDPTGLEKLVQQRLRQYAPYLWASPNFVSARTEALLSAGCPALAAEHFVRWIEYAESVDWKGLSG